MAERSEAAKVRRHALLVEAKEVVDKLRSLEKTRKWVERDRVDGVLVMQLEGKNDAGSSVICGQKVINAPMRDVIASAWAHDRRCEWDVLHRRAGIVENVHDAVDGGVRVVHALIDFDVPFVDMRDFLLVEAADINDEEGTAVIAMCSTEVDCEDEPKGEQTVRAKMHVCGLTFKSVPMRHGGFGTTCSYLIDCDLGGRLPTAIAASFMSKVPESLGSLCDACTLASGRDEDDVMSPRSVPPPAPVDVPSPTVGDDAATFSPRLAFQRFSSAVSAAVAEVTAGVDDLDTLDPGHDVVKGLDGHGPARRAPLAPAPIGGTRTGAVGVVESPSSPVKLKSNKAGPAWWAGGRCSAAGLAHVVSSIAREESVFVSDGGDGGAPVVTGKNLVDCLVLDHGCNDRKLAVDVGNALIRFHHLAPAREVEDSEPTPEFEDDATHYRFYVEARVPKQ